MKKTVLFFFMLFSAISMNSQNLSYGFVLGANYQDGEVKGSYGSISSRLSERPNIHLGAFVDYQISNRIGVKLNTQYNRSYEKYYFQLIPNGKTVTYSLNSFQLIPHLKFDVETEYDKGFYFLAGPRLSLIISADDQSGIDISDFYKSSSFGVQAGFGINFSKTFAIEVLGDYGFSDISESEPTEIRTAGVYINFNINLESIINK